MIQLTPREKAALRQYRKLMLAYIKRQTALALGWSNR